MNEPTDISQITDIEKIKALGFDLIAQLEQTQNNLRMVNQRIAELQSAPKDKDKAAK